MLQKICPKGIHLMSFCPFSCVRAARHSVMPDLIGHPIAVISTEAQRSGEIPARSKFNLPIISNLSILPAVILPQAFCLFV